MNNNTFFNSRRNFLAKSLSLLAVSALDNNLLSNVLIQDNNPITVGLIGCGWYGKSDLFRLLQIAKVNVIALADVNEKTLLDAAEKVALKNKQNKPVIYKNYVNMLANHKFDLILIATPDHWHALQLIDSVKAGANVYLQKPISHDVLEGEAVVAAVKKYKAIVQVGTQRRSTAHMIKTKNEIVDKNLLGKIGHVEMSCYYHMRSKEAPLIMDIPAELDYDLYCGPAPLLPYQGTNWRGRTEFSNGIMGDMCVHMLDTVRWLLDLGWPTKISSTGGTFIQQNTIANTADTQSATFQYPNFNCVWMHRTWGQAANEKYPWAFIIYGENGTLYGDVYKTEFVPKGGKDIIKFEVEYEREQFPEDLTEPRMELHAAPATRAHFKNLLTSIQSNIDPVANITQGHISTASCILANISMALGGRVLQYDPSKKIIVGDKQATKLLAKTYRKPFVHPFKTLS